MFSVNKIIVSFFFLFIMYYLIHYSPIGLNRLLEITNGNTILDMSMLGYSENKAYTILNQLGEDGRHFQLKYILPLDSLFPLSYGLFLFILLGYLFNSDRIRHNQLKFVNYLGLGACLSDWIENICIYNMIINYPNRMPIIVNISSISTISKTLLVVICTGFIVYGLINLVLLKYRKANT